VIVASPLDEFVKSPPLAPAWSTLTAVPAIVLLAPNTPVKFSPAIALTVLVVPTWLKLLIVAEFLLLLKEFRAKRFNLLW
jgi:hypothetical protein